VEGTIRIGLSILIEATVIQQEEEDELSIWMMTHVLVENVDGNTGLEEMRVEMCLQRSGGSSLLALLAVKKVET
jgi:hypothetical protein